MQRQWDIFCRVIDNFGDAGVCWRLACQLVAEHGLDVRLWIDDPEQLKTICPDMDAGLPVQFLDGVEIRRWEEPFVFDRVAPVVVEAFACDLPGSYVEAMADRAARPVWINLEYLTAEAWAEGCHGLASPHPTLPLVKYFFFPGYSARSGGLLRERHALHAPEWNGYGTAGTVLEISLFSYDTAPVAGLLDGIREMEAPVRLHVAPGKPLAAVRAVLAGEGPWHLGQAEVIPFPFLRPAAYDALLRRCAVNFVRGEDSLVRAIWACRPFIWQVYPQENAAHREKMEAFLDYFLSDLDVPGAAIAKRAFEAWNFGDAGDFRMAWDDFVSLRPLLDEHCERWAHRLGRQADLASALVEFSASRL